MADRAGGGEKRLGCLTLRRREEPPKEFVELARALRELWNEISKPLERFVAWLARKLDGRK